MRKKIGSLAIALLICVVFMSMFAYVASVQSDTMEVSYCNIQGVDVVDAAAVGPRYGGTLRMGLSGDPNDFCPFFNAISRIFAVCLNVYSFLIRFARGPGTVYGGAWEPDLASSWNISADGKTITFYLRKNVLWSDGVPFTASDVKFTFESHWNSTALIGAVTATASNMRASGFIDVETPDNYTVIMHYSKPIVLYKVYGSPQAMILPKHIWEGKDFKTNPARFAPVGTGPFVLVEYKKGAYADYRPNENYFLGRPYLDRFIYYFFTSSSSMLLAFDAGEIDAINSLYTPVPTAEVPRYSSTPGVKVDTWPAHTALMIMFNFQDNATATNPWVKSAAVRQAISIAINRQQINDACYSGIAMPAYGPISKPLSAYYYDPEIETMLPWGNLTAAEEMLDGAGYMRGTDGIRFSAEMVFMAEYSQQAEVIANQLSQVGIHLAVIPVEHGTYVALYENTKGGLQRYPMGMQTNVVGPDPTKPLSHLHSTMVPEAGGYNNGYYSSATIDKAFDDALDAPNEEERKTHIFTVQMVFIEDMPIGEIMYVPNVVVWRDMFVNANTRPDGQWWDAHGGPNPNAAVYWTEGRWPTDLNDDGVVNILDLSLIARAFGSRSGSPNWNAITDINRDQAVNILDISGAARDFMKTV